MPFNCFGALLSGGGGALLAEALQVLIAFEEVSEVFFSSQLSNLSISSSVEMTMSSELWSRAASISFFAYMVLDASPIVSDRQIVG